MSINRTKPQDIIDEWINSSKQRGSFVDIGGIGELSINERVSWAARCGYEKICIADIESPDHYLWKHFEENIDHNLSKKIFREFNINVDNKKSLEKLGRFDFVHSTGILYHCPNPMNTLANYRMIVDKEIIINTVIVPNSISNRHGTLSFPDSGAAFMPALVGLERNILREHYEKKFGWNIDNVSPLEGTPNNKMPYLNDAGDFSYYPYWWLLTKQSFEAALMILRLEIIDTYTWEDHAHFVWLRVKN